MSEASIGQQRRETAADAFPVDTIRAQFPILAQKIRGQRLAYLDNAATTQSPTAVMDAVREFESTIRANIHRGVHTLSQESTDAFERARADIGRFIGLTDDHGLVFTSGTTEALNTIAHGLSAGDGVPASLGPGDEVIVSGLEHHANLIPWQRAARRSGATLRILLPDTAGRVQLEDLAAILGPRTRVFALTACANATGYRPPYEAMLRMAAEAGALTVLDAAQAVSHEPLELAGLDCDFLAFSSHKMYGPMGIGALAGRLAALERLSPLRLGGDMVDWVGLEDAGFAPLPSRLEGGTQNVGGAVGMAEAARFIDSIGRPRIDAELRRLRARATEGLAAIGGITVLNPESTESAIVAFVAEDVHPHDIGTLLDERAIAVRTGHHCAMPLIERLGKGPTTRASFAAYNTDEEVDRLLEAVDAALKALA
ncbi:MAG: aminotransferase class V-fold PLP-dependent enzyme [Burkholderiaceae bacterium]